MTASQSTDTFERGQKQDRVAVGLSRRPKFWLWILLTALLLGGGGFLLWRSLFSGGPPQGGMGFGPIPVTLKTLEQETIEVSSGFVGTLDAQLGIVLKPEIDGQITRIYVSPGTVVSAGDAIFEINPERSRAELSAAQANVGVYRSLLTNTQAQLNAAKADQASAQAEVDLQNEEIRRMQYLVDEGAQSEQSLDLVERDREAAIAALNAARERVRAAEASEAEARASLSQAIAQASAVQEDFQDTQITAPIDGVVGNIPIKLGDYVESGDSLTTITQNQALDLELSVPIERQDELRTGLPVRLRRFAGDDQKVTGRISFISPQVDAATQSILVEATFENASSRLQDDQRVEAFIIWNEQPGVLVPSSAISRLGGQSFIFVAESQPDAAEGEPQLIASQRLVTLGNLQGNDYQVLDGLEPGETIVTTGILNLSDGAPIQPQDEPQASTQDVTSP